MEYSQILYQVSDRILTITLNRPERMNAFTHVMCKEVIDALHRADDDDEVRVIIITGAGNAFCAGTDLESAGGRGGDKTQLPEGFDPERDIAGMVTLTMYDLKKPVIAAFNGVAVGVGLTMMLAADIRIASENARFGLVFTRRAFVSEGASNWFLPRIVGMGKAAEWILTGRVFGVQEALAARLVTEVLPPDGLVPRARELASEIVQNTSPVSVALCRQLLWKMVGTDHPMEAHKMESKTLSWMTKNPDVIEGVMSFLEKRKPNFPMKPSKDMPDFYPWWPERPFRA
ncbi:MAG: enoyl-CoA hydratase [Chloroflexi bacterium]|nr:enoyl-CoA hydratase [Chloroflexota bacterium]MBM3175113.1 enoyl-CoA hydratase [Chloroflexota bacterium]